MLCFVRELSQETAESHGYTATTRLLPVLPIHYPFTESSTERDMKLFKQLFDMKNHEQNLWLRPQSSIGTGVAANGRVRSCRDNVPPPFRARRRPQGNLRDCQRQGGWRARRVDTPNPGELPQASSFLKSQRRCQALAKTARSQVARFQCASTRTTRLPVYRQGLNHPMLLERNMVNPPSRLVEAGDPARGADGVAGRGTLEKAKAIR